MTGAETLIAALTKSLSGSLVKAAGRRIRLELQDPERSQALERACQAGIVAVLALSQLRAALSGPPLVSAAGWTYFALVAPVVPGVVGAVFFLWLLREA